jgi:hypothetical protein
MRATAALPIPLDAPVMTTVFVALIVLSGPHSYLSDSHNLSIQILCRVVRHQI